MHYLKLVISLNYNGHSFQTVSDSPENTLHFLATIVTPWEEQCTSIVSIHDHYIKNREKWNSTPVRNAIIIDVKFNTEPTQPQHSQFLDKITSNAYTTVYVAKKTNSVSWETQFCEELFIILIKTKSKIKMLFINKARIEKQIIYD